nr:hypothetical protein [uncultured Actinoplanes sp.]
MIKGWLQGQPFAVARGWDAEAWDHAVVAQDLDVLDERLKHRLLRLVAACCDDLADLVSDQRQALGRRSGRRLIEIELHAGLVGTQLFCLFPEAGEPDLDVGVFVVESALLERGQIAVDGGRVLS